MKPTTTLVPIFCIVPVALALTACVVQDDGFRDRLAQGCRTKEECHQLYIWAHNRNAKCKKHSCKAEAEDEQTAIWLENDYLERIDSARVGAR